MPKAFVLMSVSKLQDRTDFVLSLRRAWATVVYNQARRESEIIDRGVNDQQAYAAQVRETPTYPLFAWLERGSQKMLWRAAADAVGADVTEVARDASVDAGDVRLKPDLALPGWYADWDIHLQPGSFFSDDRAGRVYEAGARLVMLGENDDYAFHRLFVETALPRRDHRRIVDLGCGFGKSTWPLKAAFPEAEVIGVDLAAPGLVLAGRRAAARGLDIAFVQADAADTGLEAGLADLVTATMFVHESPVEVLERVFAEAFRISAPGAALRILDFQFTGDRFRDLAMAEHSARNNEPYLLPMMQADMVGMAEAAGYENARWVAFDERGAGRLDALSWPAREEWHFPWAVLEADKPK